MAGTPFNTTGGIHEIPTHVVGFDVPGRMFLCGKHHIGPDVHAVIAETDEAHVVCLVERHELAGRYDTYVDWLDTNNDSRATWFAIHDMHAPPMDEARRLFSALAGRLRDGENIVVHCAAGIGRAGTTGAAVLMTLGLHDHARAVEHVRAHRPIAGPQTREQEDFLRDYEAVLRNGSNTAG